MHKEAIELFRKSASRILEDAKVYCESGYEAHSIEEKACLAAIIQFLPCFIESKPLVEHKDIYIDEEGRIWMAVYHKTWTVRYFYDRR